MTYALLNLIFLAVVAAVSLALSRRTWVISALTFAALGTLTVIFDSIMIAAKVAEYPDSMLLGIYIWLTPIEDLAWPLAAAILLPALWDRLGRGHDTRKMPHE